MVSIIEAEFAKFERNINLTEQRVLVKGVRAAFNHIMQSWPVWSGFSKANNQISITGRTIARTIPRERVAKKGAHLGDAAAAVTRGLAKLSRIKIQKGNRPRVITIGNPVIYAADAGKVGSARGFQIYIAARNKALMAIKGVK